MKVTRCFVFVLLVCLGAAAATADDDEIFLQTSVPPNVVILIDTSGSMNDPIGGVPKLASAKVVVTSLMANVSEVNFGVFRFNSAATGGEIVVPVGADVDAAIAAVNNLDATGATPLGRAATSVERYFNDGYRSTDCDLCDDESPDTPTVYSGPTEYECQKSYVIIVTDGLPNGEAEDLVADVALSMNSSDHSDLEGMQNIIVHTVGFDVPEGQALLTQTADNGGGNFYAASNTIQLMQALQEALTEIIMDNFSFARPLVTSTGADGGNLAYFSSFQPEPLSPFWRGFLKAYRKDASGQVPTDAEGQPLASALEWSAGQILAARSAGGRTIYTAVSGYRQPFTKANAAITDTALGVSGGERRDDVIDFIRGIDAYDHDGDSNTTEERPWKLGDIFHSSPVLVFPPPLKSSDASYRDFKEANKSRPTVVLVGANDGMLHAFRAADGEELWAFIPPQQLSRLKLLGNKLGSHGYYVDSSPVVADIKVGDAWKTVVVFGDRRGGRFYTALDITDTTDPRFLWNVSDASEMKESWSEPAIGKVRLADETEKFVAFVGGGYDTDDNNATGKMFMVIDLATGLPLWRYTHAASGDGSHMNFSLAASPTSVDLDLDGFTDRVYIADVGGQLWKFDVSAPGTLANGVVDNWTGKRLFNADPTQANPPPSGEYHPSQAMYGAPTLAFDPEGHLWVFIGTGDRNRPKSSSANRFYGIKDDTDMTNGSTLTEADLVDARTSDEVTQGWYLPLAQDEKVFSSAEVFHGVVYFTTFVPDSTDVCDNSTGDAMLYAVQAGSGDPGIDWPTGNPMPPSTSGAGTLSTEVGGGIPSDPSIVLGDSTDTVLVGTTDEEVMKVSLPATRTKTIRYWRERF